MTGEHGEAFTAAARALRELGDKEFTREISAELRAEAKPLGVRVIQQGAAAMPRRGGFSDVVAGAKMTQSNSLAGRNPSVRLTFKTKPSHNLKALDEGILRHPVFARPGVKRVWRAQTVRAKAFSTPFDAAGPEVASRLEAVMQSAAVRVAARAGSAG